MKKLAVVSAAALIGLGAAASTSAEASHRRGHSGAALAAGVIGGLVVDAVLGAATSNAYAAPAYTYVYAAPAYTLTPAYAPARNYGYPYTPSYYAARPSVSVGFGSPAYGYGGW